MQFLLSKTIGASAGLARSGGCLWSYSLVHEHSDVLDSALFAHDQRFGHDRKRGANWVGFGLNFGWLWRLSVQNEFDFQRAPFIGLSDILNR